MVQYKKIEYGRIAVNNMTFVANYLYKKNKYLHFTLLLYRFRKDLGMHWDEIANFTGMPPEELKKFYKHTKPVLNKFLAAVLPTLNTEELEEQWRRKPSGHGKGRLQGYYTQKEFHWYNKEKFQDRYKTSTFIFGNESDNEWKKN